MDMVTGLMALAVLIGAFFIFRAVVLWYFKIDEGITILKDILSTLKEIKEENQNRGTCVNPYRKQT